MVPSEPDIRALLQPFHGVIADASHAAMRRWIKIPPVQRAAFEHPRVFANAVWGLFCNEVTARVSGMPGVTLTRKYNTLGIVVRDKLMLRFKRVNRRGKSRNYATQTNLDFYAQCELPGIPASLPRAEIGWREDEVRIGLADLRIVMRNGTAVAWSYSILEEGGVVALPISTISPSSGPRRARVVGKKSAKRDKRHEA